MSSDSIDLEALFDSIADGSSSRSSGSPSCSAMPQRGEPAAASAVFVILTRRSK